MSEESETTKKAFLLFGDAMRSMNSEQAKTNTLLGEVIGELRALHRGHEEIIKMMSAHAEARRDLEKRVTDGERKSDGRIKLLEQTVENHGRQLATLRTAAIKG